MVYVTVRAVTYGFLLKSTVFHGSVLELYITKQILELSLKQLIAKVPNLNLGSFGLKLLGIRQIIALFLHLFLSSLTFLNM